MAEITKTFSDCSAVKKVILNLIDSGISFSVTCDDRVAWKICLKSEHSKLLSPSRLENIILSVDGSFENTENAKI